MNLHLMYDKKFAKGQIELFEGFYPGQSLYVITEGNDIASFKDYNTILLNSLSFRSLKEIMTRCNGKIENVFVYNVSDAHCLIAMYFRKKFGSRIYWMFFGSELYGNLYYRFNYPLIDDEQKTIKEFVIDKLRVIKHWPLFKRFAAKVDYFCFWNKYDYELLKRYVNTPAKLKFYAHGKGLSIDHTFSDYKTYNLDSLIQINHSASLDGNHLTILKKISTIDSDRKLKLLIPLSYGSEKIVKDVEAYVVTEKLNAQLLIDFMPKDEYFMLLGKVNVAIFGQHRQEGGGNLMRAFLSGTKVFLREDNNLLQLYRDWGLKVFSFEKDLNSLDDLLTPLSKEDQERNYIAINKEMSKEKVEESLKHFLD